MPGHRFGPRLDETENALELRGRDVQRAVDLLVLRLQLHPIDEWCKSKTGQQ
jgi:hypothetical protein